RHPEPCEGPKGKPHITSPEAWVLRTAQDDGKEDFHCFVFSLAMRAIERLVSTELSSWRALTGSAFEPERMMSHPGFFFSLRMRKRCHAPFSFLPWSSSFRSPAAKLPPTSS